VNHVTAAILGANGLVVYALVGALVFAEDALFIGFVLPGETAAVLGGVVASHGHVALWLMIAVVIAAAVVGDSVGYEVGRRFGTQLLNSRMLRKHRHKLGKAQGFLLRHGGKAVFLGRFTAFFRAVMPGLTGVSQMPYRRFLSFNALGGIIWGAIFVTVGYLAGASYALVAKTVGRDLSLAAAAAVVLAIVGWRIRTMMAERAVEAAGGGQGDEPE
jgi:membrane protein DedA with SNARE-associated domain